MQHTGSLILVFVGVLSARADDPRDHWAFRPVAPSAVPSVRGRAWVRNPIDAFVLAKLESRDWRPNPPAEPRALIRRLYLDLIGLPPTPAEMEQWAIDSSPESLDRLVNTLLARPQYGERWARHWLDVVRYAETNGYERDAAKPFVWRYRDYVINAFNADKPFDRFIREQLAGDELPDADAQTMTATTFLRLGPWDDEPADPKSDRYDQLDDIISTTAQAFLGLTLGCARCHDHKLEPLSMTDYYSWVAIFSPLQRPRNGRTELTVPLLAPGRRAPGPMPHGYLMRESAKDAGETFVLLRGQPDRPGAMVKPAMPSVAAATQPEFPPHGPHSTRRRLTLANWIASPENPLTARVIVNRIWQGHFGEGLVRTPNDFGTQGDRPTHPELLDWLADRFVRDGWSIKKLHRLILTSNTYRMSKRSDERYRDADPDNRLLWRVSYRRLEAEAIRDSILAVSGSLNPAKGGPSVLPPMPRQVLEANSDPDTVWKASSASESARRTIYVHTKRALLPPLLETLDLCDTTRSTGRRAVTTVAPQALMLFNGDFVNEQARHFASRLEREAGPDPARQIDLAYRLALCRPPTSAELKRLLEYRAAGIDTVQQARVMLNLNEFVYPD
jgi:hypothetical protein